MILHLRLLPAGHITARQHQLLSVLTKCYPEFLTTGEVDEAVSWPPGVTYRVLAQLEKRGLVQGFRGPERGIAWALAAPPVYPPASGGNQ